MDHLTEHTRFAQLICCVVTISLTYTTGASAACPELEALDELWIGGWNSHNVVRVDWQTGAHIDTFIPGSLGGLSQAHDFSFGPDGAFYVASHGNSSIRRYDGKTGAFIDLFVPPGDGLIASHSALWNQPTGTLIVASELGHLVNEYDVNGDFLGNFVAPGEAGLIGPELITVGPDGFLYLAAQSNQVLKLDPVKGGVVEVVVEDDPLTPEDETGGLMWAHAVVFMENGDMLVSSSQQSSINRYGAATGEFLGFFVAPGVGGLNFPIGMEYGPDGDLYVASFSNSLLLKYDGEDGTPLGIIANLASMGMIGPLGMHFFSGPNCPGDLDDDCVVGFADLLQLLADWGPCRDVDACCADLNDDGLVNFADLLLQLSNWG